MFTKIFLRDMLIINLRNIVIIIGKVVPKLRRGELLLRLMEERGLNAMSLSKESGVPYTTIRSMIERDLTNASIDNVIKICKVLNVSVDVFNPANILQMDNKTDQSVVSEADEDWTEEELRELERYKEFLRFKRNQN